MRTFWTRLRYAGLCTVCGYRGLFGIRPEYRTNVREALDCPRCESISRDRFLALCMSRALGLPEVMARWPVDKGIRILRTQRLPRPLPACSPRRRTTCRSAIPGRRSRA